VPQHPETALPLRVAATLLLLTLPAFAVREGPSRAGGSVPATPGQQPPKAKVGTMVGKPQQCCHSFFPVPSHTGGMMEHGEPPKSLCHLVPAPPLPWEATHGAARCSWPEEENGSRLGGWASHPQARPPPQAYSSGFPLQINMDLRQLTV